MRRLAGILRRFAADPRGAISVEAVLILPLLLWALAASFVFWDAFRASNAHQKASYAVTDMLTREMTGITAGYITGMHIVYRHMLQTDEPSWLRVSSVQFRASDNTLRVLWSRSTDTARAPVLTNATIMALRARIPVMAPDDTVILVETWRGFTPLFDVGIAPRVFHQFTVARPRWLSPLPLVS